MYNDLLEVSSIVPPQTINAVGIPTRDRPSELRRSIDSLINHCKERSRNPHIIIVDSSEIGKHTEENRRFVDSAKAVYGERSINHISLDQILSLVGNLARTSSVPYHVVHFCLAGISGIADRLGASRNLIALSTQGLSTLFLDDDILPNLYTLRDNTNGSPSMPGIVPLSRFFPNRLELLRAIEPSSESVFDIHEQFLGRELQNCKLTLDTQQSLVVHGEHPNSSRIRATVMGVAGSITTDKPTLSFCRAMATGAYNHLNEKGFRQVLEAGETVRVVEQPEVSSHALPTAYCLGFDNSYRSPPWFPALRSQDLVFGAVLSITNPNALVCDLPWAVLHDRPGQRRFTSQLMTARYCQVSGCELLAYALRKMATTRGNDARNLEVLGELLVSVGTEDTHVFDNWVATLLKEIKIGKLQGLQSFRQLCYSSPVFIQGQIDQTIQMLTADISNDKLISDIPMSLGDPQQTFRAMILLFGELMIRWGDISVGFSEACTISGLVDIL